MRKGRSCKNCQQTVDRLHLDTEVEALQTNEGERIGENALVNASHCAALSDGSRAGETQGVYVLGKTAAKEEEKKSRTVLGEEDFVREAVVPPREGTDEFKPLVKC